MSWAAGLALTVLQAQPETEAGSALVVDGAAGPALAFVRSLGRAGWRVLAPAGSRSAASRYAAGAVDLPDVCEGPRQFADAVAREVARHQIEIVVPSTDAALLALRELEGRLGEARILGGASCWTDKRWALEAAARAGFPVPRWLAPAGEQEALEGLRELGPPCVVKPRRSYAPVGGRLVQRRHGFAWDAVSLAKQLRRLAEPDGELPLLQEYVPGRAMSVGAVLVDGRVVASAARETFSFAPVAGGNSVWKHTVPLDDVGVREALALLVAEGYAGLGEVEYQIDASGTPRFMEVSPRPFGWLPLVVRAGVDLPLIAAQGLTGRATAPPGRYRAGVEMRWPAGEIVRLRAALARYADLPPGVTRRAVIAKAWPPWRPGMSYDGLDVHDLRPWFPR
jgi:ATP-grasp domain-containing protein